MRLQEGLMERGVVSFICFPGPGSGTRRQVVSEGRHEIGKMVGFTR